MYSVAAIKASVAVVSFGLGIVAVAVTVGIQRNPRMFTSPEPVVVEAPYVARQAPLPVAAAVTIPEIEISAAPQTFETKTVVKQVTKRFTAAKPAQAPAPKAEDVDPTKDRVIPAPCHDGEYRKLDERQGVRLMCPGRP